MKRFLGWLLVTSLCAGSISAAQSTQPASTTAASAPTTRAATPPQVDLMPLINPRLDGLRGKWTLRGGVLRSSGGGDELLQFPYEPPEEYDYEVHFVRVRGDNCVIQILSHENMPFIWVMGTGASKRFTFHYLKGAGDFENRTTRDYTQMASGREYVSVVKVRRDGVKAYLDGELVSTWDTDYSDVENRPFWRLQDSAALGLATSALETEFRSIRVTEVSGKGKILRPPMPVAFQKINEQFDDPKSWSVKQNSLHTMTDGRLRCEGSASISFNGDIPAESRISFHLSVASGPAPRIYFDGAGICIASAGHTSAITVQSAPNNLKPIPHLKGDPIPYKAGEDLECAMEFHAGRFEFFVNDHSISGDCQSTKTSRLSLRGSTGYARDSADIWDLRVEPVDDRASDPK
jgi:hypothetical protein